MRLVLLSLLSIVVAVSLTASVAAQGPPFVDDFENYDAGDNAGSVWEEVYSYEDEFSSGGAEVVEDGSQVLEVSRAYLWHNTMNRLFAGKMKVVESSDDFDWYGSRLSLVNQDNPLERYEVRLYPNTNKFQVNYVDRTGRTGIMSQDELITTSEILDSSECNIEADKWYYVLIMKNGPDKWKAMLFSWNRPTCHVEWQDDRIETNRPAIGIQSAGKFVTTNFDEIFAI